MKIKFFGHAGIKIEDDLVLLIDPWLNGNPLAPMKAEDISIGDIIDIIDGQVALTVCVEEDKNHCCELESMCPSQGNWQIINNTIREALNSVSIAEMANPFVANLQYKKSMNLFTTNKRIE